ncbi:MAG TPA: bifunctional 4-hydroxy-3-methylbut-2-enyl diphosphate reductase/30S ribosomal protein S1 [Clostridiales bacterium]|nr:bifunctional 4-hydroxy-3-methylbut-2-enyl diphosphate reductase/30S ribosomal protein S1 [Clostridiales bacterium]
MKIILDKHAGFCFGVKNAVDQTLKAIKENQDKKIYTYGSLIHNRHVTEDLKRKGVEEIENLKDIKDDNSLIIIRSHGVPRSIINEINSKGIKYVDCTCPFVSRIHRIVEDKYCKGYKIVIVGDKKHPEVIGINGWCNNEAIIIDDEKMVDKLPYYDKICLVAQTTFSKNLWHRIKERVKEKFNNAEIFDTICNATENRQKSVIELAKKVDVMLVIGGFNSSNTIKLYELARQYCPNTYHIENAEDLAKETIMKAETIGVSAGASTPDWIIKEVINKMEDLNTLNIMEEYEKSFKTLHPGETVKGTVISYNDEEVFVNIGYKADGIIKKEDLTWDIEQKVSDIVNIGDEIEVKVVSINDGEGNVVLSKKLVDAEKNWYKLEYAYNEKTPVPGVVKEIVKGGAIVEVYGIRAFMPASLFDIKYINDLESYKNDKINVKVIEFDKDKRKVVVSRKDYLLDEKEKKINEFWKNAEVGQKVIGEVKRITDFGAFVDIGGVDGLIHISELSYSRIDHPSEVVKPGDKVEVVILALDKDNNKISLGLKQTMPEPWSTIENKYHIGDIIEAKVVRFANFGAFVEVESGIDGLVHISQISDKRIAKPSDVLQIGETIKAKIIDINIPEKKMSLSIKEVDQ